MQGKTTAELQAPTGYTGIYEYWNLFGDDLWDFGASNQYPVLKADMNADGVATWQEFGSQRGNEPSPSGWRGNIPAKAPSPLTVRTAESGPVTASPPNPPGRAPMPASSPSPWSRAGSCHAAGIRRRCLHVSAAGRGQDRHRPVPERRPYLIRETHSSINQNLPAGTYTIEATTSMPTTWIPSS